MGLSSRFGLVANMSTLKNTEGAVPKRSKRLRWLGLGFAGATIGFLAILIWGIPPVAKTQILQAANSNLQGSLEIDSLKIRWWKSGIQLNGLRLRSEGGEPVVFLSEASAEIRLGSLLLGDAIRIEKIQLADWTVWIERNSSAELNLGQLAPSSGATVEESAEDSNEQRGWVLENVDISGGTVHWKDGSLTEAIAVTLNEIHFSLAGLSHAGPDPATFSLEFKGMDGGHGVLAGEFALQPISLRTNVEVHSMNPRAWLGYLPETVPLEADGRINLFADVSLESQPELQLLVSQGKLEFTDFHFEYAPSVDGEIQYLSIFPIELRLSPLSVRVGEVTARDWRVTTTVASSVPTLDKVDLESLPPAEEIIAAESAEQALPDSEETLPPGEGPDISIESIVLNNGHFSFLDTGPEPDNSFNVEPLTILLTGIDGRGEKPAKVEIEGATHGGGTILLTGEMDGLDPYNFCMVELNSTNIELLPFSGYAVQAIGQPITEGRLFFEAAIAIQEEQLDARNSLLLRGLSLGPVVEGYAGTRYSTGAALTLMKNSSGDIPLNFSVGGDMGDPNFNPAEVFFQILAGTFLKTFTAPLNVAGNVAGGLMGVVAGGVGAVLGNQSGSDKPEEAATELPSEPWEEKPKESQPTSDEGGGDGE